MILPARACHLVLALTLVVAAGCVTMKGVPPCPGAGGPAWRVVETDHFSLYTDAGSATARRQALDLELTRSALAQVLAPGWEGPQGRIPVLLLEGEGHFSTFFPGGIAGVFTELFFQPIVFLADESMGFRRDVLLKHELTHYLVDDYANVAEMPGWVAEGLATYFETLEIDRKAGRLTVGKSADERVRVALAKYHPDRLKGGFSAEMIEALAGEPYGQYWIKVHYLINTHGEAFAAYLEGLHAGQTSPLAWNAAFPELPASGLDGQMKAYIEHGRYVVRTIGLRVPDTKLTERPLSDADVHGWRAILYTRRAANKIFSETGTGQLARDEIAEALRLDPGNILALAARFVLDREVSLQDAQRATTAHPEAWMGWFFLGQAQAKTDEAAAWSSIKEALRRAGTNPSIRLVDELQHRRRRRSGHE